MKTLQIYKMLAGVAFAATLVCQLAAQELVKQPFSISISALSPSYKAGDSVDLKIVMTNTSDHEINASAVYEGSINSSYEYYVRDIAGNVPQKKEHKGPWRLSTITRTLKPGESVTDNTNVARSLDLSQPGEYAIQVSRRINGHVDDEVVKSNTITITVLPKEDTEPK